MKYFTLVVVFIVFIAHTLVPTASSREINKAISFYSAFNGRPIKLVDSGDNQVYLFLNGSLNPIKNSDTLNALGYEWEDIKYLPTTYFKKLQNSSAPLFGESLDMYANNKKVMSMKKRSKTADRTSFELPEAYTATFAKVKSSFEKFSVFASERGNASCAHASFISLTENTYGRFGNAFIELKNAILVSEYLNKTMIIPRWFESMYLSVFNLNRIKEHLCIITWLEYHEKGYFGYVEHIETKTSLAGTPVWYEDLYQDLNTQLPAFNQDLLPSLDRMSLKVHDSHALSGNIFSL
jgi:hypothetical protein